MSQALVILLFAFLFVVALVVIRLRDLFSAVMLLGIFSLLSAALFTVMDAVDVAFTEASVGAGISTVLMLATLALTTYVEAEPKKRRKRYTVLPLVAVFVTGGALIYGTFDMPHYGDPDAPIHQHVAPDYLKSDEKTGIPNVVTSVLASYRGYDTFGETTVIFTAVLGVLLLLGGRKKDEEEAP